MGARERRRRSLRWTTDPAKEFSSLTRDGMSPAMAIQSATLQAANLMHMDDEVGAIEPGKLAGHL
ncbi:amidohydrolase family protein [Alloacidobacterium sp.]|uniref:amidohydrolase family protein n=1 Tax=Alloacidobacterium sp. TaxID=2951999 RepID=UPI002D445018|nr:amidohydrolase family protein [Alloacidobacterium sp.]HYK36923.1 amidohydrolase family protein [Alloacidobacterium sp.]